MLYKCPAVKRGLSVGCPGLLHPAGTCAPLAPTIGVYALDAQWMNWLTRQLSIPSKLAF